jgi:N utilization substance protein B
MTAFNVRHAARALALQVLYEVDLSQHQPGTVLSRHFVESPELPDELRAFASELVSGVVAGIPQWDARIHACAPDYPVETLAAIDRNVLRIALLELERGDVPAKVVVNEAVELAKEFGGDAAPRFVNGVLASAIVRYHSASVSNVSDRDQASS